MTSAYTSRIRLTKQGSGDNDSTWGTVLNDEVIDLTDFSIAGYTTISLAAGDVALTTNDGLADQARSAMLELSGILTDARNVYLPAVSKMYVVRNNTSGAHASTVLVYGGTGYAVPQGESVVIYCDAVSVREAASTHFPSLTVTGNVGIGTSSPSQLLTVGTGANGSGIGLATYGTMWNEYNTGDTLIASNLYGSTTALGTVLSGNTSALYGAAAIRLGLAYGNITFYTNAASSVTKGAAYTPTERMFIDSAGNVGIGTVAPAAKLSVSDGTVTLITSPNAYGSIGYFGTITNHVLGILTNNIERMRIDNSGNVGIGTSSPTQKLEVVGNILQTSSGQLLQQDGTNTIYWGLNPVSIANSFGVSTAQTIPFIIANNNTERMRIDSSGNLLVGTTTLPASAPGAKLYSADSIAAAVGIYCKAGGAATTFGNVFNINWTGSAAALWIDNSNIGNITISSDYRIKRNISTQTAPALNRIMALRPVTYQMADYGTLFKSNDAIKEGFIAHEVQEIIPSGASGVKDDENEIQSLKVDAILAVVVKAMQEQQVIIEALTARITALEE